jgi:hypothetical protein
MSRRQRFILPIAVLFTLASGGVAAAQNDTKGPQTSPQPVPGNASPQGQAVSGMSGSPIPGSSTTGRATGVGGGAKHLHRHPHKSRQS